MPAFVPYTSAPTHLGAFRSTPSFTLSNAVGGAPFLTDIYGPNSRFIVQWAPGAYILGDPDAFPWEDISGYVIQPNAGGGPAVNITPMGRSDEFSIGQPAGCVFKVKNNTGKFSKGPQNPNVKLNVPIRVLLQLGANTGLSTRFYGYANGFPVTADSTGNYQVVTISASGSTRRLFQGTAPLRTAMARMNLSLSPAVYWECDSPSGSDRALSSVAAVDALLASSTTVQFGSTALSAGGVSTFIDTRNGGMLTASISNYLQFNPTSWTMEIVAGYGNTSPVSPPIIIQVNFANGSSAGFTMPITLADGKPHHISYNLLQVGPDVQTRIYYDGVFDHTATTAGLTLAQPRGVIVNPLGFGAANVDNPLVSNIVFFAVLSTDSSLRARAMNGWTGESATDRLARLCNEEGITLDLHGASSVAMGAQTTATRQALLRECEAADRGILVDGFGPGLSYWSHSMRSILVTSPAMTLAVGNASGGDLSAFQPVDNDQRVLNKFTMNRKNGGKAVAEDSTSPLGDGTNGIGSYESSDTINVSSDAALLNQAWWRVREGTNNEPYRYPGIDINFANTRSAQHGQDWLNLSLMSRIDGTNPELYMSSHPAGTISSVLEGYTEGIGSRYWKVSAVLGPAHPWDADVLAQTFRLDTGGSNLADAAVAGATSLNVIVTGNALWATSAALPQDFPMWLDVNGYPVRLTAADAYSNSNPYFETDASGWQVLGGTSTFTQSNLQQHQGAFSGRLSPDGVTSGIQIRTDEVVAQAGQFWTAEGWVRSTLGHTWSMFINWYDLSHTLISSVTLASLSLNSATWTRFPVADPSVPILAPTMLGAIAPTGTQFARLGFIVPDVLNVTDFTYFDQVRLIGKRQQFTVDATTVALPANATVKLWKPAVLAL